MRSIIFLIILISGISAFRCGYNDESEKIVAPKFHTAADEGIWTDMGVTHVPVITFKETGEIEVTVPMKPVKNPIHYIEKIALMEGNREIASKNISFTYDQPRAIFRLPKSEKPNFKVVVKCNLHDMWTAPVTVPKSGASR